MTWDLGYRLHQIVDTGQLIEFVFELIFFELIILLFVVVFVLDIEEVALNDDVFVGLWSSFLLLFV